MIYHEIAPKQFREFKMQKAIRQLPDKIIHPSQCYGERTVKNLKLFLYIRFS